MYAHEFTSFDKHLAFCLDGSNATGLLNQINIKKNLSSINSLSRVFDSISLAEDFQQANDFQQLKMHFKTLMFNIKKEIDEADLTDLDGISKFIISQRNKKELDRVLNETALLTCREILNKNKIKKLILDTLNPLGLKEISDSLKLFNNKDSEEIVQHQILASYFNMYLISNIMNQIVENIMDPIERNKYECNIQNRIQELSKDQNFFSDQLRIGYLIKKEHKIKSCLSYAISYLSSHGHNAKKLKLVKSNFPELNNEFNAKKSHNLLINSNVFDGDKILKYVGDTSPELAIEIIHRIKSTFPVQYGYADAGILIHENLLPNLDLQKEDNFLYAIYLLIRLNFETEAYKLLQNVLVDFDIIDEQNIKKAFQELTKKPNSDFSMPIR